MSTLSCCDVEEHTNTATSEHVSIPELTELDQTLVRATEAALDATVQSIDANANNEASDCQSFRAPLSREASKAKTIGRRFRSLFSFRRKSTKRSSLLHKPLPKLNDEGPSQTDTFGAPTDLHEQQLRQFQELVKDGQLRAARSSRNSPRDETDGNNSQSRTCGGGCRSGAHVVSPIAQTQVSPGPQLTNLSNASDTSPGIVNSPAAAPTDGQKKEPSSANETPSEAKKKTVASNRVCLFRGGPTTQGHRRKQMDLFRECRIMPLDTLYKKVSIAPGQERLFLSAPKNLRPPLNPFIYDIAYENFRHHSDCNRDIVRTNLKNCSNYRRPSQFRYVY